VSGAVIMVRLAQPAWVVRGTDQFGRNSLDFPCTFLVEKKVIAIFFWKNELHNCIKL